jgi:hypothetical protein
MRTLLLASILVACGGKDKIADLAPMRPFRRIHR